MNYDNLTEAEQLELVSNSNRVFGYVKFPCESIQFKHILNSGYNIRLFKNPSEAVQLAAVTNSGRAIKDIKHPSEAVQLAAVKNDWGAIEYIENPSKTVQIEAANKLISLDEIDWKIEIYSHNEIAIGCKTQSLQEWMRYEGREYHPIIMNKLKKLLYEVVVSQRGKHELR